MSGDIIRVLDLETTGLAPPAEVIEIGWTDLVSQGDDLVGEPANFYLPPFLPPAQTILVKPRGPIPPETSAIHHLTDKDVAEGAPLDIAMGFAMARPACARVVIYAAHNKKMEQQWLGPERTGEGARWICTYKCALRLWPEAPGHSNQALRYWRGLKLDYRMALLPPHRAGVDAYVTALLLLDMLRLAQPYQLVEWSGQPALLPRMPFGDMKGRPWAEADDGFLDWCLRKRGDDEDVVFTARHEIERRRRERAQGGEAHHGA